MPEGDTIARTARSLSRWLQGREITAARSTRVRVPPERLVGQRVETVEARAKHVLIRFASGEVLHTHMRMTGSWHVYPAGQRWRRPAHQARLVLEAGDRVAVCFNAPVIELLAGRAEVDHPSLANLGPDVLVVPVEVNEVRRRAEALAPEVTVAELLLDQRVISGIGNIWRSEALFAVKADPFASWRAVVLHDVVEAANRLMTASVEPAGVVPRRVYRRTGRPCVRCGTAIESALVGSDRRRVYWCPSCQRRIP